MCNHARNLRAYTCKNPLAPTQNVTFPSPQPICTDANPSRCAADERLRRCISLEHHFPFTFCVDASTRPQSARLKSHACNARDGNCWHALASMQMGPRNDMNAICIDATPDAQRTWLNLRRFRRLSPTDRLKMHADERSRPQVSPLSALVSCRYRRCRHRHRLAQRPTSCVLRRRRRRAWTSTCWRPVFLLRVERRMSGRTQPAKAKSKKKSDPDT